MWGKQNKTKQNIQTQWWVRIVIIASIFLKYVFLSPSPPLHPDVLGPRLDLWHKTGFFASAVVLFHPLRQWTYFFPIVKGPCVLSQVLNWCQSSQLPVLFLPGHFGICRVVGCGWVSWVMSREGEDCGYFTELWRVFYVYWQKKQSCWPGDLGPSVGD